MEYIGSYVIASNVPFSFNTRDADGAPITFAGTPLLTTLNAATLAVVEASLAPSIDVNAVTGRHLIVIDTSGGAYSGITELIIAVQQGTVDGVSVAGEQLARFTLTAGTLPAGSVNAAAFAADTKDADGNLYAHSRRIGSVKLGVGGAAPASPIGEIA